MNMKFSKKLLLTFSAIGFISYGVIWACGGGDWDEYGTSNYAPEAFVDSAYKPFFYSDQFYYEIGYDNKHVYRFNKTIVAEWKSYLGKAASEAELSYFLLEASSGIVDSVLTMPIKSLPPAIQGMSMVQNKQDKNLTAFFEFLSNAKANETYAATTHDYWDYDEKEVKTAPSALQLSVAAAMEKKFNNTKDKFIRQRYFFQLIRNYFFQGKYDECIAFYEKYKTEFPANILSARCSSYIAGAYFKQKKYAQSNYLFSKVYDVSTDFKTVAYFSFHPQEENDWQQTLKLCQNKEEQITLWQLLGTYFDEQRAIKEIYMLNPQSDKLELLLSRLVNLQEIRVNTGHEYGSGSFNPAKDSLDKNALAMVSSIADAAKTSKPYMWYLSAGYLHFINEDYATAKSYYAKAEKNLPKTELAQAQLRMFKLMNTVASCKKMDDNIEAAICADLFWLQKDAQNIPAFRYVNAYEWIKRNIAGKYKKQKEDLKSELYVHDDTYYTNVKMVAELKAYLLAANAGPVDQYHKTIYPISAADISEYQAITLVYQDKLDEAIPLMQEGANKQQTLLGNPFNGNIKDCHDCDHAAAQKVKYTKLDLLLKLKEMKANVSAGTDVYNNALLLGNAFYNMSYYGNARVFYECSVIGSSYSSPEYISNSFQEMLVKQDLAKKYYTKALAAAGTDEQKAKLTYLLLKCQRNELYNKVYKTEDLGSWEYADAPATNFSLLKPFKATKYYQEVIAECGYFRSYLGMK